MPKLEVGSICTLPTRLDASSSFGFSFFFVSKKGGVGAAWRVSFVVLAAEWGEGECGSRWRGRKRMDWER